mmetsp:Transcript_4762/g.8108  ORF Transcript_4762/g.8108 Transcript_4762/m.8108 type:complete len:205 (+) Transcript_4762:123-737(+)
MFLLSSSMRIVVAFDIFLLPLAALISLIALTRCSCLPSFAVYQPWTGMYCPGNVCPVTLPIRSICVENVTIAASILRLKAELRKHWISGRTWSDNSSAVPFHRPPVCWSITVKSKSNARSFMFCLLRCLAACSHLSSNTANFCGVRVSMSNVSVPLNKPRTVVMTAPATKLKNMVRQHLLCSQRQTPEWPLLPLFELDFSSSPA